MLDPSKIALRVVLDPMYQIRKESMNFVRRLVDLDDKKKMLIEFFDDKVEVVFKTIEAVVAKGASFEQTLNYEVGVTAGEYDSVLLAWKEKVRHDLVRPTTYIRNYMSDERFVTWGVPHHNGTKIIDGKNFEAYLRVMPHSEYVSGSACICQSIYEFTDLWISENLDIQDSVEVSLTFAAGSSKIAPGFTPASDINMKLNNMQELRDKCGKSRLDGGMHFTQSVPAGYKLCEGVGTAAFDYSKELYG